MRQNHLKYDIITLISQLRCVYSVDITVENVILSMHDNRLRQALYATNRFSKFIVG